MSPSWLYIGTAHVVSVACVHTCAGTQNDHLGESFPTGAWHMADCMPYQAWPMRRGSDHPRSTRQASGKVPFRFYVWAFSKAGVVPLALFFVFALLSRGFSFLSEYTVGLYGSQNSVDERASSVAAAATVFGNNGTAIRAAAERGFLGGQTSRSMPTASAEGPTPNLKAPKGTTR